MDNDIKIKNNNSQRHKDVLLFLNDELKNLQVDSKNETYNLEEEYAATKKHKSPFTFLVLFFSFLIVILCSWLIIKNISNENREIKVELQEFDDLNLKNLIDSVSKVQNGYDTSVKNKTALLKEKESLLEEANNERERELFLIESLNLRNKKEIEKRKQSVEDSYLAKVNQIEKDFQQKISSVQAEIDEYSKQLLQFDSNKIESAKEKEQMLNTERQIQKLEIEQISKNYETRIENLQKTLLNERERFNDNMKSSISEVATKYQAEIDLLDPLLKDSNAEKIINEQKKNSIGNLNVKSILIKKNISDSESPLFKNINKFQADYESHLYLQRPFNNIPYKNSLSKYVTASNQLVYNLGQTFETTTTDLVNEVSNLNSQIEQIKKDHELEIEQIKMNSDSNLKEKLLLIDSLLVRIKANAAIISASSPEDVMIYVAPHARYLVIPEGTNVEFKSNKTVKGQIFANVENSTGIYSFVPSADKNGSVIEFESGDFLIGVPVKLLE